MSQNQQRQCVAVLSTKARCKREGGYYVNRHYACSRHLERVIRFRAVINDQNDLWASVQVLFKRPSSLELLRAPLVEDTKNEESK